jgi:RHS repeat-associated protein
VRKLASGGITTVFVYDAMGELSAEYEVDPNPGDPGDARVQYMTNDHLGSPRIVTDANGAVVSRKDFTAFGEEVLTAQRTAALGYVPPEVQQDYTGYYRDDESGLEYAKARYYNPQHGRFTSVDPMTASATVRNPQSFNRYSYVLNSPYKFTDPLGLMAACNRGRCTHLEYSNDGSFDTPGRAANRTEERRPRRLTTQEKIFYSAQQSLMDQAKAKMDQMAGLTIESASTSSVSYTYETNWVIRDVGLFERTYSAGTKDGFYSSDSKGNPVRYCATLPQAWDAQYFGLTEDQRRNRMYRLTENWIMGDAVTPNMQLARGTVLANFDRTTGRYKNLSEGNHTLVFLEWTKSGMIVIDQGPNWMPYAHEITFQDEKYYRNPSLFNVVRIKVYEREERIY